MTENLLVSLNDIEEKEASWLVPQRMPKGQIIILAGDGGRQAMKEKQKPPRQHSLDRFQQWSMKVIEESKNQKGDHENEKKEIEETADLLRPGFSRLGGISYLTGSVR